MTVQDIFDKLNAFAPVETALEFDNVGILVGNKANEVTRVLVSLDITQAVVDEACAKGANLIVSHHPVIFSPLRAVESQSVVGRLLKHDISAICMHTNLDAAKGGVNDTLARLLGLCDVVIPEEDPLMRIGTIPTCTMPEFLQTVCTKLSLPTVKYRGEKRVSKIGLCGGSACEGAALAYRMGCDTYLTGEVKHHIWLDEGENLIEAGHFATEAPVCQPLVDLLSDAYPNLEVEAAEQNRDPSCYFLSKE